MKLFRVVILCVVAVSCATNPATGRRQLILMSESEEIALGRQSDAEIRQQMGVYNDNNLQAYVDRLGQRLAQQSFRPNLKWSFTVVDESAVNAFALPGGFIYVTRGILPFLRNEAELAGVLGHEIGHVDGKHTVDQYSKQQLVGGALVGAAIFLPKWQNALGAGSLAAQLMFLKFGRDAELESDRLGVGYASGAGWAPAAMQGVLGTLGRLDEAQGSRRGVPNWALTHPPAADRITELQDAIAAARAKGGTQTNDAEFERMIDGIVVGDSREKGMVRGSDFIHPVMRFSLRFPEGWEIMNGAQQVTAVPGEQANVAMLLQLSSNRNASPQQAARADMSGAGLQQTSGESTRINGLDAYIGTYEGVQENQRVIFRVAHIRSGDQMYVVAGLATPGNFPQADRTFSQTIQSFRQLSAGEAERIQPDRLDFHTVRQGDTWESIARGRGASPLRPSTVAIMNNSDPSNPPKPGTRIRVIAGS